MPTPQPIALPSEGGAYALDSKTGQLVLIERTAPAEPATETPAPAAADVSPQPAE